MYQRIHPVVVYTAIAAMLLWLTSFAGSLSFALAWVPRQLWGKIPGGPAIAVRVWPLAALLLCVALAGSVIVAQSKEANIGVVSPFLVWIMLTTAGYGVVAVMGAWTSWRKCAAPKSRLLYWSMGSQACIHLLATLYLGWHGMIGFRTWARISI